MPSLDSPLRIALAGAAAVLVLSVLVASLFVSDFSLTFFDTVHVQTTSGQMLLTRHNPFGIIALAALLVLPLAGLSATGARLWPRMQKMLSGASADPLGTEISRASEVIRKLIDINGSYAASLGRHNTSLEGKSDAKTVQQILTALVGEHQRMRSETSRLADELEGKQAEKRAMEEKLSQVTAEGMADSLTGIGNRRAFDQNLAAAIAHARESGTTLSLVMADIDHFKRINDAHGHPVGDEILKLLARIIEASVRDTDTAARYGGEEFGIIMPKASLEVAKAVAERVRKKFEARKLSLRQSGKSVGRVTASFGVAELRIDDTSKTLVQRADRKLYAAKSAGRNRVVG